MLVKNSTAPKRYQKTPKQIKLRYAQKSVSFPCFDIFYIKLLFIFCKLQWPTFSWPTKKKHPEMTSFRVRPFQKKMAAVDIDVPVDTEPQIGNPEDMER